MRILLCHNFYCEPGGEDQVFANEGQLLESRGHTVLRYTAHNRVIASMNRVQVAWRTVRNSHTYGEVRELIGRERPDVMHCHNTFPLLSPAIYAAANEAGVPVVQTLHNYRLLCPSALLLRNGQPCEDCMGKLVAWPGILHGCYRQDRAATAVVATMLTVHRRRGTWLRGVGRFIALSEFSRGKFIAGGLPEEKISVKANFIRHDAGPGGGRGGYAVFVGRLAAEKGLSTLLTAWQRQKTPYRLKIVGDGPLAGQVRAAATANPQIEWLGHRPSAEVLELLGSAECLVLPSVCYENCPATLIESFAKGTPAIASRLGAMAEMVDHGRTGLLFEPGNADDLNRCLEFALMGGAASAMRPAVRREFENKYTSDTNYAQLMEIYGRAGCQPALLALEQPAVLAPRVRETMGISSATDSGEMRVPANGVAAAGGAGTFQ